ncbi:MAG: glycosyltransferase family 4 protein [Candidatus Riflebacteria bacterium]|nr:glycosyltransferase family 4 protein [Candidatus Riflebacteria bacterium]
MITLFGPLPPPVNGHTLAFKCLVEGLKEGSVDYKLVDYSPRLFDAKKSQILFYRIFEYFLILFKYFQYLRREKKQVVYITLNQAVNGALRDLILILIAKMFNHKVVVHIHGGMYDEILKKIPGSFRKLFLSALKKCSKIIVLSENLRKMFDDFPELKKKLVVVKNGLPFCIKNQQSQYEKDINPNDWISLLFLSNMIETKGWLETLEMVKILVREKGLNIRARFCGPFQIMPGDKKFRSAIEAREAFFEFIKQNFLEKNVEYFEFVDEAKKIESLMGAQFMIFPSRYPNEGQPLVLIEGLAYGCVLVGTDYRAIPDMIRNGESGILTSSDPEKMAESIYFLVNNSDEYRRLSKGARDLFVREFTREKYIKNMLEILLD